MVKNRVKSLVFMNRLTIIIWLPTKSTGLRFIVWPWLFKMWESPMEKKTAYDFKIITVHNYPKKNVVWRSRFSSQLDNEISHVQKFWRSATQDRRWGQLILKTKPPATYDSQELWWGCVCILQYGSAKAHSKDWLVNTHNTNLFLGYINNTSTHSNTLLLIRWPHVRANTC